MTRLLLLLAIAAGAAVPAAAGDRCVTIEFGGEFDVCELAPDNRLTSVGAATCTNTDRLMDQSSTTGEDVGAGDCWVTKIADATTDPIVSMSMWIEDCRAADSDCNWVLFNDTAGEPSSLIYQTGAINIGTGGYTEQTISVTGTPTGTTVWVGVCAELSSLSVYRSTGEAANSSKRDSSVADWADLSGGWEGSTTSPTKKLRGKIVQCV